MPYHITGQAIAAFQPWPERDAQSPFGVKFFRSFRKKIPFIFA
jgi:hypothetical protein